MSKPKKPTKCKNALLHFIVFFVLSTFRKQFPLSARQKNYKKIKKCFVSVSLLGRGNKQNIFFHFSCFF
jgi:hypothetical protein